MKTVAWATLIASLASLAITIALATKLQVAKEDALASFDALKAKAFGLFGLD